MYPQVFGKYVLERELARGGMARVVLATLRGAGGFEKKLVVKQIRDELACDDDFVKRFVLEAKTTVKLAHPNIVPVYELGVELGTYFLAMEFVEGVSLAELLRARAPGAPDDRRGARLSPEEGAYVGVEVCRALDYAHRRMNVVHRDVTPRNVMVDEEGQVKVIDFGIAAPVATASSAHGIFGSPGHMPPEQMDAKELTPAADVFAVAVLLMELWSGSAPFRRRSREEVERALSEPHPKPSDADIRLVPLDDVFASAMALDSKARPQHADDLGRALRRFLAGVDLGDLARQLGDRVRDLRAHPSPNPSEPRPVLQRPASRPTATLVGTKTFAVREEVGALGATHSADPAIDVSTRRIESNAPGAPKTPIRVGETVATQPLEADRPIRLPTARRGVLLLAAVAAIVPAVGAFYVGRAARGDAAVSASVSTGSTVFASSRSTASASSRSTPEMLAPVPVEADPGSLGSQGLAREAPSIGAAIPPISPSVTVVARPEHARLVLQGDGAFVSVDGVPRGACPAYVTLEPGPHAVVFSFPPTGEHQSTSTTLRSGDRTTLRADFTSAKPSIVALPH